MRKAALALACFVLTAISIAAQPVAALPGQKANFVVTYESGNPPESIQWRKNGVAIPGATAAQYVVSALAPGDGGIYSAVVSNAAGSTVSNELTLTVDDRTAPVIATHPADAQPREGTAFSLEVVASGKPAPSFEWRKNGEIIPGATTSKLSFASIKRTDSGLYDVVVRNEVGTVSSNLAAIDVIYPPSAPVIKLQLAAVTVRRGETATFITDATDADRYRWIDNKGKVRSETGPILVLRSVNPSYAGWYSVEAYNLAGKSAPSSAPLIVQ
jgi:hypothetical protein